MKSKNIMRSSKWILLISTIVWMDIILSSTVAIPHDQKLKVKRQLYREQLLPSQGGKIPDSAFQADRLALNRLNKEGISIPDGILLEQRHRESHYQEQRHDPDISKNIIRLVQTPDGRYTPIYGRYPSFDNEIESTYIIRPPSQSHHHLVLPPFTPLLNSLEIPTTTYYGKIYSNGHHNNLYIDNRLQQNSIYPPVQDWTTWESVLTGIDTIKDFSLSAVLKKVGYIPDYPSYTEIPLTSFVCDKSGRMYPDPEAKCQVFHLCHYNGHKETFLCPPGTRFESLKNECSPWHKTQCVNNHPKV